MNNNTDNGTVLAYVNVTKPVPPQPDWYYTVYLTVTVVHLVLNSIVILPFITDKHLRTPFTVYVMCLLITNILLGCFLNILEVVGLDHGMVTNLSPAWCIIYQYMDTVFAAGSPCSHVLITINRLWAFVFPVSYRQYHTTKMAVLICIPMWAYVHVVAFPFYVVNELHYRVKVEIFGCITNVGAQPIWNGSLIICLYVLPTAIVVFSYPLLWHFHQKRNRIAHSTKSSGSSKSSEAFSALTCLTISVTICWLPTDIYYVINDLTDVDVSFVDEVASVLFVVQGALDPLLFVVSLKGLKDSLGNIPKKLIRLLR